MVTGLVVLLVSAFLLTAGCEKVERYRKVVVYSPYGQRILDDFKERFEAAYADEEIPIRAEIHQIAAPSILERLNDERIRPRCDVWWGGETTLFMDAKDLGFLDPHPAAEIAENIRPEHRDQNYYWFGTCITPYVIIYNKKRITEFNIPETWADLLNSRYNKRILLRDVVDSTIMQNFLCVMMAHFYERNSSNNEGYRWLSRLHSQCLPYSKTTEGLFAALNTGEEAVLSIWPLPDTMVRGVRYNYDFGYAVPTNGAPASVEGIAIVRGAPHLETAKRFLDFVTSRESQLYLAGPESGYFRIPTRTDLGEDLPEWLRSINWDTFFMPIDWDLVREHRGEWIDHWIQEIKPET